MLAKHSLDSQAHQIWCSNPASLFFSFLWLSTCKDIGNRSLPFIYTTSIHNKPIVVQLQNPLPMRKLIVSKTSRNDRWIPAIQCSIGTALWGVKCWAKPPYTAHSKVAKWVRQIWSLRYATNAVGGIWNNLRIKSRIRDFFCWQLLGYVPGGAPFSQVNIGVTDAMAIIKSWWGSSSKTTKTCETRPENHPQKPS